MLKEKTINYKKSGIYVIEFDNGIKFGISKNINSRIYSEYKSPWCRDFKQVKVFAHPDPKHVERALKKHFKNYLTKHSTEFVAGVEFHVICSFISRNEKIKPNTSYEYSAVYTLPKIKTKEDIIETLYSKYEPL